MGFSYAFSWGAFNEAFPPPSLDNIFLDFFVPPRAAAGETVYQAFSLWAFVGAKKNDMQLTFREIKRVTLGYFTV